MAYMECKCPGCNKSIKEKTNAWGYGSPIKICPHCGGEYIDRRFREVAVEGFDPRSTDGKFYLKGMLLMLGIALASGALTAYSIMTTGRYSIKGAACIFAGILGTVGCAVMYIRIKSGLEEKNNEKYMLESRSRMTNPEYVRKLANYGYELPEEYRNK